MPENPYDPPTTETKAPRRRTRWRIVFVTPLMILGILGLPASVTPLLIAYLRPAELGGGITWVVLADAALSATGAVLLIATAVWCWRGRWLYTCVAFTLALGVSGIGDYLASL